MSGRWFPDSVPSPSATERTKPFWDAAREHRLVVLRCASCGEFRHPPRPICPYCASFDATWTDVAGTGTVFTFSVVYQPFHPSFKEVLPYVIAHVELDGTGGTRILSNIVDIDPEAVVVGLPVEVVFEDMSAELSVPRFRPRR
ncbi:MAG: Zn-ribbon domain-containing OB-fold protein [Acidimicrobiia bacterium]